MSSHRLRIEFGRWTRPRSTPINERICSMCNVLEDEFHFIFECPLYFHLRVKYIKKYYWKHPSMMKLIELCKTDNVIEIKNFSKYVYYAFDVRNEIVSG